MKKALIIGVLGAIASILVSRVLITTVMPGLNVSLDPDRFSELGRNLSKGLGMMYDRSHMPATDRGPGYPGFLALIFLLTGSTSLVAIQLFQAVLHGLTAFLVFLSAEKLAGEKKGLIAASIIAFFPSLLWYTSRIWAETLLTCLFALLVYLLIWVMEKPNIQRIIPLGVVLGFILLTKSVLLFFPFLLCIIWYVEWKDIGVGMAALVIAIAAIIVMPWTIRNSEVLKHFLPVHTTLGINLFEGNVLSENFGSAPLASQPHWILGAAKADTIAPGWLDPMTSYNKDVVLVQASLSQMAHKPLYIARHLAVNLATFFYLGETPIKSLGFLLLQVPLAFLAYAGMTGGWRDPRVRAIGWLFIYYVAVHAAVYGTARFAAPLIPAMVVLAFSYLGKDTRQEIVMTEEE